MDVCERARAYTAQRRQKSMNTRRGRKPLKEIKNTKKTTKKTPKTTHKVTLEQLVRSNVICKRWTSEGMSWYLSTYHYTHLRQSIKSWFKNDKINYMAMLVGEAMEKYEKHSERHAQAVTTGQDYPFVVMENLVGSMARAELRLIKAKNNLLRVMQ